MVRHASSGRISYSPGAGASPDGELNALSVCYRFILDCHARKQVVGPTEKPNDRDDAKELEHGVAAGSIPRGD
jgi:hypothetical protein